MTSTATSLNLRCVISSELASTAFLMKNIPSNSDVDDLKEAIWTKKKSLFENVKDASQLGLWRVTIPIVEEEPDEVITAANINSKRIMKGKAILAYLQNGVPEDTIHIIVERPKVQVTQAPESEKRIAELLEEIEDLRGGKSIIVLNVVVRPNRSECFSWTTDTETTTIKELERAIYLEYPDREDGDAILAIIHARGTPQHEGGGIERLGDDTQFRNILLQYRKTNTKTITVALETPTKKYTDFTLTE
ncbi:hypothetical protein BGX21_006142, partial [Mortierella sp. AD011]